MAEDKIYKRSLEETPTRAVTVVCFVLLAISIIIEHFIHAIGKWFKKKHKSALYESLENVKGELMMLGFISMLLTMFQGPLSKICISQNVASTWHPCSNPKFDAKSDADTNGRKLLQYLDPIQQCVLAAKGYDKCAEKGKVAFISANGIHQLRIFIFVLAIFHILQCIITLALGRTKMRRWKKWEDETKTVEYQFNNDPKRFGLAKDTTFGQRHLNTWSQSSISLWIVSFFRQFFGSVEKVDYFALRHGFIMAHLAPRSDVRFGFQKYIKRSLDEDFKVVVGISPIIWLFAVLFLLTNTHGWYSYYWLLFIPLIIVLLVGAKLQMIITKMGLTIQDRGEVVKGAPMVEPGDDLFWFNRPCFVLFTIHLVLFQNDFQLTHFACSTMGSTKKPNIFNDRVAAALKKWHHTAKKHVKYSKNSETNNTTIFFSGSSTPTFGMSPIHLLHRHPISKSDNAQTSPRTSNYENGQCDVEGSASTSNHLVTDENQMQVLEPRLTTELPIGTKHEINISSSEFSFEKRNTRRD